MVHRFMQLKDWLMANSQPISQPRQSQRMLDEAKQKVQQAYEIAPELKPKKGKGRPAKDSSIFEG